MLVALWIALCCGLGVWFAEEIRDVKSLARTLETAGRGLESTSRALDGVPSFVGGDEVRQVAADAGQAGRQARASAGDARRALNTLSILTGATVALVPTGAMLIFYLPMRLAERRRRPGPEP